MTCATVEYEQLLNLDMKDYVIFSFFLKKEKILSNITHQQLLIESKRSEELLSLYYIACFCMLWLDVNDLLADLILKRNILYFCQISSAQCG